MRIAQILAKQSETKLTQAKKLIVRELEEVEVKGNFVAYVDEAEESYDINVQLDKEVVVGHSCDCGRRDSYCIHQIAILLMLSSEKESPSATKKSSKPAKGKKVKESEQLLLMLEQEVLASWLLELFKSNKDIELQFLMKFGKNKQEYKETDVAKTLKDTVVSVVGKRKKIEASEVKKIIQLWEKALDPFWEYLALNIGNERIIDLFSAVHQAVLDLEYKFFYTGTRFRKFIETGNSKIAGIIAHVDSDIQWVALTNSYWDKMWSEQNSEGGMLELFIQIYESSSTERKRLLADKIEDLITSLLEGRYHMSVAVDSFFLDVLLENNMFDDSADYFVPRQWEAKFNLKLIEAIRDHDPNKAIDYCNRVIAGNVNSTYNDPFLEILEDIYADSGDFSKLASIKMEKFSSAPNIVDYVFIMDHSNDEELKKKFRTRTLSMLRNNMGYAGSDELYFRILEYEKNYKKMLEVIDYRVRPSVLLKFWKYLYAHDKLRFLRAIAANVQIDYRTDPSALEQLILKITDNYESDVIKIFFKPDAWSSHQRTFKAMVYSRLDSLK
ncbi:SWIM zinc finger family protein [Sphingobacterium sp. 2149]|uniref:SWIM zinc finger family protein n=1 Tax=Sphingobacterium sp. 2149 TaxID=2817763 RepID=UPI001AE51EDB|nr:SWIM zinc finger family protein [Sphingobacterium sp. 2149]MDR6737198.1 tetratricopeptide (TPR) repeat protein [Sphingobacterium sp. 2149]